MKKSVVFILISLFFVNCFADINNFNAKEIYIGYYLSDNYANVIEYDIVHDEYLPDQTKDDVTYLIDNIKNAEYAEKKYSYDYFKAAEESISNEGKFIKINLDLISNHNTNTQTISDLFSKTLKRNVTVKIENNKMNLYFDGEGIDIVSYNAEAAYQKEKTILLSWPTSLNKMELVFDLKNNNSESILSLINGKISSPEKTAEEIDYLKNSSPALEKKEQEYQDDCDIVRLQHLVYYGKLIEEYKQKVGKYPFEGENQQVYAFIYNKKQKKYSKDTNTTKHKLISPKDFFAELEKGLGRKIDQLYDPQYVPSGRPVLYMYMIDHNQYYFAVHISKYYPFSKKVDSNYYKVELSNIPDKKYKFYTVEEIENNNVYLEACKKELGEYFEIRKKEHIREYK